MSLTAKKVEYNFEEPLNLHILLVSFSSFPLCIAGQNRAKLKKLFNLNSILSWVAQYPRYLEYIYYFLISNCNASAFLK